MHKPYYNIFLDTQYIVYPNERSSEPIIIKIGEMHPFLDMMIAPQTSWAFITAWNPLPLVLGDDENQQRNKELKHQILSMGLPCFDAKGITLDKSWHEDSFLVSGISMQQSKELALQYGQLAFIYGEAGKPAQLVYTKED
jgi:hypothetical protein